MGAKLQVREWNRQRHEKEWSFGDVGAVTSFGEDSSGELYITTGEGRVYKIVKSASP